MRIDRHGAPRAGAGPPRALDQSTRARCGRRAGMAARAARHASGAGSGRPRLDARIRRSSPVRRARAQRTPRLRDHYRERRRGAGDRSATRRPAARDRTRGRTCACSGPSTSPARLDDRFRLLTAASAPADKRHQTLRAAIEWSFELLDPREQEVASPALRVRRAVRTRRGNRHRSCRRRGRHRRRLVRFGRPIPGIGRTRAGHDRYRLLETIQVYRESDYSAPFSRHKPANGTASGTCTSWKRPRHIFEARMPTSG